MRLVAATVISLLLGTLLSACGGKSDHPPAAPEIVAAIKARKANYKEIGGAFKTLTDEIKSGAPDVNALGPMARDIVTRSQGQLQHFPPGSGPESGEKTRAKADIWSDQAGFTRAHEDFVLRAQQLVQALEGPADPTMLAERHKALGASCKTCHDRYRLPDE